MSGGYGAARSGKIKVKAEIRFKGFTRRVRTHLFISVYDDALAVVERIERKFDAPLEVLRIRTIDGFELFAAPEKKAA